jgi:hypothetical protein
MVVSTDSARAVTVIVIVENLSGSCYCCVGEDAAAMVPVLC